MRNGSITMPSAEICSNRDSKPASASKIVNYRQVSFQYDLIIKVITQLCQLVVIDFKW